MFGLFRKKPSWEEAYAQNIYGGLVAHKDFGDVTAISLRMPTALHNRDKSAIAPYPTSVMFNSYNAALKQFLEARGAMKRLEFTDVHGSQIIAPGYRACP